MRGCTAFVARLGLLAGLLTTACGGGSGTSGDTLVSAAPVASALGLDRFLIFPNPQLMADGRSQIDSMAYAEAYYAAIDPGGAKNTLAKWKAANGFGSGSGSEHTVVFGDIRDLGYGRRMTGRRNVDGTIAFVVDNYIVNPGSSYTFAQPSVEAAVVQDTRWRAGINAIEYSPGPAGGAGFAKFFSFHPVSGERELTIDLDGRGAKAMPGVCISCHGGRGDALTPTDARTGKPLFPLVQNTASQHRGDVQAQLHPFEVDAFAFSSQAGFRREDQEAALKALNALVLCTYPRAPAEDPLLPENQCRRAAIDSEWQGSAGRLIRQGYGGAGLPAARYTEPPVPADWIAHGQSTLYQDVVATACRVCHLVRGTGAQSDIDFDSRDKFAGFDDRIKAHTVDRGNMPLARIVFDAYQRSNGPGLLANFLGDRGFPVRDASGQPLRPGRPVADPGPARVVQAGRPVLLSAAGSLFADSFAWTIASGPAGASLGDANAERPTFTAPAAAQDNDTYTLRLVATRAGVQSAPAELTLVVKAALAPAPDAIRFNDIKSVLQDPARCASCHSPRAPGPGTLAQRPPVFFSDTAGNPIDRNQDGRIDDTDDEWLHAEVLGRINFSDIVASPLLRKPAGLHHQGGRQIGFDVDQVPGDSARAGYDLFLNWILHRAPR